MNKGKKIAAASMAGLTLLGSAAGLAGCGSNTGSGDWAVKSENATLNSGVYKYCLFYAYQQAMYQVEDYNKPILNQKIGDKAAKEWIQEQALEIAVPFLVAEEKMKQYDLTLTDTARYNAERSAASDWESYGEMLEKYGITQSDLQYATYDYSAKYTDIFLAIYGIDGEKEITEEQLHEYFLKNYTNLDMIMIPTSSMEDDEIADLTAQLKAGQKQINAGEKTMEDIAKAYLKSQEKTESDAKKEDTSSEASEAAEDDLDTSEILSSQVGAFNSEAGYPEEFIKAVAELKKDKAKFLDLTDYGYAVLVQKHAIKDAEEKFFDTENVDTDTNYDDGKHSYTANRFQLMVDMKSDEYQSMMEEAAKNYDVDSLQFNEEEYNIDLKALFEPEEDAEESKKQDGDTESSAASKAESKEEKASSES